MVVGGVEVVDATLEEESSVTLTSKAPSEVKTSAIVAEREVVSSVIDWL